MSGFGVAATRLGLPDTGPISYSEMLDQGRNICLAFVDTGADVTFLEAPRTEAEMRDYCKSSSGCKMANLIEIGKTPLLPTCQILQMGYKIAVYALTLPNASIAGMQRALAGSKREEKIPGLMDFKTLRQIVGFDAYNAELDRYHREK